MSRPIDGALLWRVGFEVPACAAPAYADALESVCHAVGWFGEEGDAVWRIEGVAGDPPDRPAFHARTAAVAAALGLAPPRLEFSALPARNWLAESFASFPPLTAGRYDVRGAHVAEPAPPGRVALRLDAGAAFGSGEHASTFGCLLALDALARRRRFANVLDLGCGSGILALAAARTWPARVLASDIDPEAAAVARANARRNGLAGRVAVVVGDGYSHPAIRDRRPYDLILANILARPLVRRAGALARHLASGGVAVLGGFLDADAAWVAATHRVHGLRVMRKAVRDGWATLVITRPCLACRAATE